MSQRLIKTSWLAKKLGCSTATIYRYVKQGRLKPTVKLSGKFRWDLEDVLKQLKKGEEEK